MSWGPLSSSRVDLEVREGEAKQARISREGSIGEKWVEKLLQDRIGQFE